MLGGLLSDILGRKKYPIIVGGFFRSGTSLVRRIIDSHPDIHCPPEIKFFKDLYQDYFNDILKPVRFFATVRTMGLEPDEILNIFGPGFIECHKLAAKKLNKRRWADKNPENLLYLNEWHKLLRGKMLFIFVLRNPLDATASLIEANFETIPATFEEKVEWYLRYINGGIEFMDKYPNQSFLIKYEDLVRNPKGELEKLFAFIGEEFQEEVLAEFNSDQRQSGTEDPKVYLKKDIHSQSVGRYKNDLTEDQIDYMKSKCRTIFYRFGY